MQDDEDDEEVDALEQHGLRIPRHALQHVDSQVIRHRFNAHNELQQQQDVRSRGELADGMLFESQSSLDSQSKRAFAISFAG